MPIKNFEELCEQSFYYAKEKNFFQDNSICYSSDLSGLMDYKIAQSVEADKPIFFGSLNSQGEFPYLVRDVLVKGLNSPFYGCVLCTDNGSISREKDGAKWDYYKNMAFWSGGMDAGRNFVLVTNIAWYYNKGNPNPNSGTCAEILWLLDNGYNCKPDPQNSNYTIFYPSDNPPVLSFLKMERKDPKSESIKLAGLIRQILSTRELMTISNNNPRRTPFEIISVNQFKFFKKTTVVEEKESMSEFTSQLRT